MKSLSSIIVAAAVTAVLGFGSGAAVAGPYILAGTDADDHGSATATANQEGWFFMQRALENLAPGVTNGNKIVYAVGSDPGTQAGDAASSAFGFSNLAGQGWTFQYVNGDAAINAFFAGGGAGTVADAGIVMFDSSSNNVSGGADGTELSAITANATEINNFLGAGGALFSQANGYGYLTALLPNLGIVDESDTGLTLTNAGSSAFPGLTNADLSAGPYHNSFSNVGNIPVLAISNATDNPVIIGSSGGTIIDPGPIGVPEPATMALLGTGLLGLGLVRRRRS